MYVKLTKVKNTGHSLEAFGRTSVLAGEILQETVDSAGTLPPGLRLLGSARPSASDSPRLKGMKTRERSLSYLRRILRSWRYLVELFAGDVAVHGAPCSANRRGGVHGAGFSEIGL